MYKVVVKAKVTGSEEVQILTEYGDYYDSFVNIIDDSNLLKRLETVVEDNLVEYLDDNLQLKLQDNSISSFKYKNELIIESDFVATTRLTKQELEQLKSNVSNQYSDGYYDECYIVNTYNGYKNKDYVLSIEWETITIEQTKL